MNSFWNVFEDTGDPICYLLYRAGQAGGDDDKGDRTGQETAESVSP